ncbi:DNA polymerase III subunit gamma/tau [Candidatus Methylopumilus planktonicus]|uniref:DNA polymerase III subunit gamma/tau n=1 Tax=Candidatus Methylopumilus planktonicus TaxID=1581557 RepID=UPI0011231A88|nr:DNA polymerase III subunit gamma/tau [Candidatus Methylopumilus planktonicus]QDD11016.1 DNA polymerase III subunit gamma/tau [Candidatus Methylopumilus planktonicus]QDD23486.1 DNA polymerase III subunit gamma/tau [Candidatus Methylopumilus planktonicus]
MSYQVLARKYRPRSFDTLVGQAHVVQALKNALDQKRLHHAYLFTGTRGVGKTTLARILTKALNCKKGISSTPCGTCSACTEIDQGRYVDLIEVDAASNTQVDNMRDLLDNAQYAPTQGQFKIYIIDEVHMLSKSAFNAMLKTLEEPPEHVKFILATTDPQKVPVTVLSRCLQFNLKQMPSASISEYMEKILNEEAINYEINAIYLIAKSANGSMRDALSILDQGIAYCGGTIEEATIKKMLGAIDQSYLFNLVHAVIDQDGHKAIEIAKQMDERNLSFDAALNDLANLIQTISVTQAIPDSLEASYLDRDQVIALTKKISAEQLQLFYQITILGRRDLYLAPDEYAGFTMTILRMLSFTPQDSLIAKNSTPAKTEPVNSTNKIETIVKSNDVSSEASEIKKKIEVDHQVDESILKEIPAFNGNWRELVDQLKLGLVKALAQQSELVSFKNNEIILSIADEHKHLLNETYQKKLELSLSDHFSQRIKLVILQKGANNSPLKQKQEERSIIMKDTENSILQDQFVKSLLTEFNAEIIPSSIKPNQTT